MPEPGCAVCGVALTRDDAYLSSAGAVCDACHKRDAVAQRHRNASRETNVEALLGGIFATASGAGLGLVGLFSDVVPIKLCLLCAVVVVIAYGRVFKLSTER